MMVTMEEEQGKRRYRKKREPRPEESLESRMARWVPKTELGKLVQRGEVTSMEQVYEKNLAILEPEIVDYLVPNMKEEVLDVRMVQRSTDSGRKGSFMVTAAVGNKDGFVGVGTGKGQEVRPTIERAVREAKKNIISITRGCGSWQCGCGEAHSMPFKTLGRYSSVSIELLPAPKGTGIVAGGTSKKILELSGVKDVWSKTKGNTRTVFNFGRATINALRQTRKRKIKGE